jgi:hypothetical protein
MLHIGPGQLGCLLLAVLHLHYGTVQHLSLLYFKFNLVDERSQVRLILVLSAGGRFAGMTNFFILDLLVRREDGVG